MPNPDCAHRPVAPAIADQLLDCFVLDGDPDSREFLSFVIASGRVPTQDMDALFDIGTMYITEAWDMVSDCAAVLQSRPGGGAQHAPNRPPELFLGMLVSGRGRGLVGDRTSSETSKRGRKKKRKEKRGDTCPPPGGNKGSGAARQGAFRTRTESGYWEGAGAEQPEDRSWRRTHGQLEAYEEDVHAQQALLTCAIGDEDRDGEIPSSEKNDPTRTTGGLPSAASKRPLEALEEALDDEPPSIQDLEQSLFAPSLPRRERGKSPRIEASCTSRRNVPKLSGQIRSGLGLGVKAKATMTSPFFSQATAPPPPGASEPCPSPPAPDGSARKGRAATRPPPGTVSSLPIPPLTASRFGLIQEELAHDPFRLLIAITFLIRTTAKAAIPVFRQVMDRWPTPAALAEADAEKDMIPLIRHLGLSSLRCAVIQKYARTWLKRPPTREKRYGVRNYPDKGDGRNVKSGEEFDGETEGEENHGRDGGGGSSSKDHGRAEMQAALDDHDEGTQQDQDVAVADAIADSSGKRGFGCSWEIGHLTQGRYALDSWRIFCRDVLLGRADDWTGQGQDLGFQPEWMRVLPEDKELRACLRWMWMREGWEWNPLNGEKAVLREEMSQAVNEGRVGYDDHGDLIIQ